MLKSGASLQVKRLAIRLETKELSWLTLLVLLFCGLALWQLDRHSEKGRQQALLAEKRAAPAVSLLSLRDPVSAHHSGLRVKLEGRYINQQVLIEQTYFQGRSGYEVFTPFEIAVDGRWVLVSRGWQADIVPGADTEIFTGSGPIEGVITLPPSNAFFLPPKVQGQHWPVLLHHFQLTSIQTLYDKDLPAFVIRLGVGQTGALHRHWVNIPSKATNHIAYALQWFSFSLLALGVYIIRNSNALELLQLTTIKNQNIK